jgi:hypothetical protein
MGKLKANIISLSEFTWRQAKTIGQNLASREATLNNEKDMPYI